MTFNSQETFQSNNRPTPKEVMAWFQLLITLITTTLIIGLHLTLMRPPAPRAAEHLSCRWCAPGRSPSLSWLEDRTGRDAVVSPLHASTSYFLTWLKDWENHPT